MDFDVIMREITSGMSGRGEEDIKYLQAQMEKYKDHEMGKEIIRACGRLLFELIPDDAKEELAAIMRNDAAAYDATLDEVRFNMYKKDFQKALSIIEALIKKVEDVDMFRNDAVSEYYTFDEPIEEVLFKIIEKPQKAVRRADIPFSEIYLYYGNLLFEMKRYEDAQNALRKSLRWNPMCADATFEYIETYKAAGDHEVFFELSKNALKHVFTNSDIARCYRNIAYYFVEKKQYFEAVACYLLSSEFDRESKQVQSELYYVSGQCEGKLPEPTAEDVNAIAEKYGFQVGPSDDVLGAAYGIGKQCFENKQYDIARYFLDIAYELTESADIKNMLDQIPVH